MAFKTQDDIGIDGAGKSIFVFVKFLAEGDPKFTLYKDAAETAVYSPHEFDVPPAATAALYFWLTANSDAGARFAAAPCVWDTAQPPTVNDAHMTANGKAFSLRVNNWSPRDGDGSYSFQLVVEDDGGVHHGSETFEVDPTIIEKGDPGTY